MPEFTRPMQGGPKMKQIDFRSVLGKIKRNVWMIKGTKSNIDWVAGLEVQWRLFMRMLVMVW